MEEYVETSDPEEIGYHYVWRKTGKGKRVLDTVRVPVGNMSKRVKLSPAKNAGGSCLLDVHEGKELSIDSDTSQDPLLIQAVSPPPETESLGYTDPSTPATSLLSVRRLQSSSPSHSPPNSQDPLRMSPQRSNDPFHDERRSSNNDGLDDPVERDFSVSVTPAWPSSREQSTEDDSMQLSSISPLSSSPPSPTSPRGNVPQGQTIESPIQVVMNALSSGPRDRHNQGQESALASAPHIDPPRDLPRYTLRQRTRRQEKPYLFDLAEYKAILQHVPEAIVNHRSPPRGDHHRHPQDRYEEEESQDLIYQASDDDENDDILPRSKRTESIHVTDSVLLGLPESDEEDRKQIAALRKEWRGMERQRKNEAKAAEKEARRKKKIAVHSFPMNHDSSNKASPASEPSVRQHHDTSSASYHRTRASSSEINTLTNSSMHFPSTPLPSQPYHSHSPTSGSPFAQNTYHTPIVIESERENDNSLVPMVSPTTDDDEAPRSSLRRNSIRKTKFIPPDSDTSDFESAAAKKERRRMRTLNKMYPTFMLPALDKEAGKRRQQQTYTLLDSEMAPGHARKTLKKGNALADVRGDVNTSEEDDLNRGRSVSRNPSLSPIPSVRRSHSPNLFNTPSTSPSPDHSRRIRPVKDHQDVTYKHADVIKISDDSSESESSSSSSEIEHMEITSYVHGSNSSIAGTSRSRHENLIDYMLAKNCRIGRKQRSGERKSKGKGKERGGGDEGLNGSGRRKIGHSYKQTHLTFDNHHTRHSESTAVSNRHVSANGGERFTASSYAPELSERHRSSSRSPNRQPSRAPTPQQAIEADKQKKTKKQKDKEKRARAKANGIYVFAGNGTSITTGRRREAVTFEGGEGGEVHDLQVGKRRRRRYRKDGKNLTHIRAKDLFDEDFRNAIASATKIPKPRLQHNSVLETAYRKADVVEKAVELEAQARNTPPQLKAEQSPEVFDNTRPLACGIAFGPFTCIGKGILSQLLDGSDNSLTVSYSAHGFTIDSLTTSIDLQSMLPGICNGALESLNDLPDDDDDDGRSREWEYLLRGVCRAISLHMSKGETRETDKEALKSSICDQSTKIISRLQDADIDLTMLNLCWFAVEILLRAAFSPTSPHLCNAIKLLLTHASRFGISKALSHVRSNKQLADSSSIPQRIAEIWVCLIHVTPVNMFWKLVENVLQDRIGNDGDGLDSSEAIWTSLFGVCALAQFTVHGVTTSNSRLPPAWNIVSLALKQIRLGADVIDSTLPSKTLKTRDRYIRLLVARCFLLTSLWKWKLDSPATSTVFNQLLEIFRSRNFANLVGEKKPDFPAFVSTHNWRLCSQYNEDDTAFELYLKLIVQAAGGTDTNDQGGRVVSPRTRKLLSLVTPQSALTFGDGPTASTDFSMLYNRVAAVSLTIYLDPFTHASRLCHARKYVNFQQADANTRTVFIQCLMRLSVLMVVSRIPMTETFAWFGDIGDVLAQEVRSKKGGAFDKTILHINLLLRSLRYIIVSYGEIKEYPDPGFFVHLTNLFQALCGTNNDATTLELMRLIQSFLSERAKIVPAPTRPSLPETETEESQESQYDVEQWDMTDPHLLAALDDGSTAPAKDYTSNDSEIVAGRKLDGIRWLFFRTFKEYIQKTKLDESLLLRAEDFLDTWLGCVDVILRHDTHNKGWLHVLDMGREEIWSSLQDVRRKRRIEIRVMFNVLRLDPKAYFEFPDRFLDCLLPALVPVTGPSELTIENEFLSLLLSIDGARHPLLRNLPFGRPNSAVDYNISVSELQGVRWEALRSIFTTVNESLQRGESIVDRPEAEGQKHLRRCISFLSVLRDLCQSLPPYMNTAKRKEYEGDCLRVWELMQEQPQLTARNQPRLGYWGNWALNLRRHQETS